jgi:hypothetical protein
LGDWIEARADVQRIGRLLAFVNVYLVVNDKRIVRASGVYLRQGGVEGAPSERQSTTRGADDE